MTILDFLTFCGTFHPERDHLIVYKSLDDYIQSTCQWVQLTDKSLSAYVLSCHMDNFFIEERLHGYDFCLVLSQPRCFNTICESVKVYKIYGYDEYDNLIYVTYQPSEHKAVALIARLEMSGDYHNMFWVYG